MYMLQLGINSWSFYLWL